MKKIKFLLAGIILFQFVSCSVDDENTNIKEVSEVKDVEKTSDSLSTKGLRELSLKEHELDITILVPEVYYTDEDDLQWFTPPTIIHNDGEARWEIKMPGDRYWHLVIEDMGDEICDINREKEEHGFQKDIFDFKYHQEKDNQLLYSKILKSENTTFDDKEILLLPNYHFYCSRNIGGSNIIFRSFEMGDFRKPTVDRMMVSALKAAQVTSP